LRRTSGPRQGFQSSFDLAVDADNRAWAQHPPSIQYRPFMVNS